MKTLVLSDIHLRHTVAQSIIDSHPEVDNIIFTGDYFDNWNDTAEQNLEMAKWVKSKLDDSKYTLLVGNHDMAYLYHENKHTECSGFTTLKKDIIRSVISDTDVEKFKFAHFAENIIFSHAGFDRYLFSYFHKLESLVRQKGNIEMLFFGSKMGLMNYNSIKDWVNDNHNDIILNLRRGKYLPLFGAGMNRGGPQEVGGIIWQDEANHLIIRGVNQIFGHSIRQEPLFQFYNKDKTPMYKAVQRENLIKEEWFKDGFSLCLDTNNRDYLIIENGWINFYKCSYRIKKDKDFYNDGYEVLEINKTPYNSVKYK
jgi:hypothetical protein